MRFFNFGASEIFLLFLLAILAVGPKETLRLFRQARDILKSLQNTFLELTGEFSRVASETLEDPVEKKVNG